ncbi:RNA polymerase sigma factor [Belliella filtrata]|nr:RNA polymerase sigma factor [Belliella filtrata]
MSKFIHQHVVMTSKELEVLIKAHHREAFLWSRQCCGFDTSLAEDILQHAYLKVLEGKAKFGHQSSPKTWLFAIVRYTAMEWLRNEKPTHSLEGVEIEDIEPDRPVESQEDMLNLLPSRQKEVLLLVFYHQMTIEKAAEIMEVSLGTARTHYERAKKSLKMLIEKKHENAR